MGTAKTKKKNPWPDYEAISKDGRRQRSGRSRRQIIEALFELNRKGNLTPTAVEVAEKAGVGLRSVFRHFEDMDSIYEEMTEELSAITMPKVLAPFKATDWRDRLDELIDRNADIFELVFPSQVSLAMRRYNSDFLERQYSREIMLIRTGLRNFLPEKITANPTLFAAFEVLPTFATWRRLREDQNLSVEDAKRTLKLMMQAIIATVDGD